jgi:hypothetical protein
MHEIVNLDLLTNPLNWVIVFLILYFLSLMTKYVDDSMKNVGVHILG